MFLFLLLIFSVFVLHPPLVVMLSSVSVPERGRTGSESLQAGSVTFPFGSLPKKCFYTRRNHTFLVQTIWQWQGRLNSTKDLSQPNDEESPRLALPVSCVMILFALLFPISKSFYIYWIVFLHKWTRIRWKFFKKTFQLITHWVNFFLYFHTLISQRNFFCLIFGVWKLRQINQLVR